MEKVGIFYGSTTGKTAEAASQLQQFFGLDNAEIYEVANTSEEKINDFKNIVFGSSTWGIGDVPEDFEEFLEGMNHLDFSDKKVAIFGLGDQESYPESFVDAIGCIYKVVNNNGAEVVGQVETDPYCFYESTAEINGRFVGLPLDEENQSDLSTKRLEKWVEELKNAFY